MTSLEEISVLDVASDGAFDAEIARGVDVVAHNPSGSRRPLVMIRTWSHTGEYIRDIAQHLGPDQPVYSIAPPDFDDPERYPRTTSQWVDFFARRTATLPLSGPFVLGGWSWGGVVALELAESLAKQGEDVRLVLMLDTRAPEKQPFSKPIKGNFVTGRARLAARFVAEFRSIERPRKRWKFVRRKLFPAYHRRKRERRKRRKAEAAALEREKRRLEFSETGQVPESGFVVTSQGERMNPLKHAVQSSYVKYELHPTSLPVAILWTRESHVYRRNDPSLGWAPFLEGAYRCVEISGTHRTMFDAPNDRKISAQIAELLAQEF